MFENEFPALLPLLEMVNEGIVIIDQTAHIIYVNPAIEKIFDFTSDELIGHSVDILIPVRFRQHHHARVANFQKNMNSKLQMGLRPIIPAVNKDGDEIEILVSITNLNDTNKKYSVALIYSVEGQSKEAQAFRKIAETDALTGLGNRLYLSEQVQSHLERNLPFTLLFLDLNKFKPINDQYGHQEGDIVLKHMAERFKRSVRSKDCVTRVGGDEFVILLEELSNHDEIIKIANKVYNAVKQPMKSKKLIHQISASIGGAIYPKHGTTEQEIIRAADKAMYFAKKNNLEFKMAE
jgi:diguanylate cyclase (GGDEF)-like protein/PAS domain S-box-containing protein